METLLGCGDVFVVHPGVIGFMLLEHGIVLVGFLDELKNSLVNFTFCEEVRHLSTIEDIVDIFKEGFIHQLSVREEENHVLNLNSQLLVEVDLEIFTPGSKVVTLGDFKVHDGELGEESGELSERLTSRTTHSD